MRFLRGAVNPQRYGRFRSPAWHIRCCPLEPRSTARKLDSDLRGRNFQHMGCAHALQYSEPHRSAASLKPAFQRQPANAARQCSAICSEKCGVG
jgi:hypothetical protein